MTRQERRDAVFAQRKADRKAGFPPTPPTPTPAPAAEPTSNSDELEKAELLNEIRRSGISAAEWNRIENMVIPKSPISAKQQEANINNSRKSTGPTSSDGLKKVSQNALKTGLTGAQVLLPTDDAERYEAMIVEYRDIFLPVGPEETALVQSIVDCRWRLARIPGLESAMLDLGRRKMVRQIPELADNPPLTLEMQVRLYYEKQFRNLELQENRLTRRREREMKELLALQAARKAKEAEEKPPAKPQPQSQPENGFVFSTPQINEEIQQPAASKANEADPVHAAVA